jgi:predicted DNA-binding transcriptional regulator AlpA
MSETMSLDSLLSTKQVAQVLNVSPSWLAKARMMGTGPEYIEIGRAIRYSPMTLKQFIAERTTNKKSPAGKYQILIRSKRSNTCAQYYDDVYLESIEIHLRTSPSIWGKEELILMSEKAVLIEKSFADAIAMIAAAQELPE